MRHVSNRDLTQRLGVVVVVALTVVLSACAGPTTTSVPTAGATAPALTRAPATPISITPSPAPATPSPTLAALPAGCTVVAGALYNPRGLSVGPDGTLYIAEAGDGGQEPDYPAPTGAPGSLTPPAGTPAASPIAFHGDTGRVTTVSVAGIQQVFVDGLTSYIFGPEVVGPAGVAVGDDGTVYVAIGGPGPGTALFPPADNANSIVAVDAAGIVTPLADLGEFERVNNPEPFAIDSNLGEVALGSDGLLYVADSGGNDLLSVDPETGTIELVAVMPGLPMPDGAANPGRGGLAEADPVPVSVVADPDGGVFVGLLGGGPLWSVPGSTKVVHVDPDGTVTDAATGLNMVVGVARDSGRLYASQFSTNFFPPFDEGDPGAVPPPPAPGSVVRATDGGEPETVIDGLPMPYGIAFAPDGDLYVAINASAPPGSPPNGQVLKCQVPTEERPTPAPETPGPTPAESPAATEPSSPRPTETPAVTPPESPSASP